MAKDMDEHAAEALIREQCARYPLLEARDAVKALYQAEFGCGHLVSASGEGLSRLEIEARDCMLAHREAMLPLAEPRGGSIARVPLPALGASGLSLGTLYRLFVMSAGAPAGDARAFDAALERLLALAKDGGLPFGVEDARRFLAEYRRAGCPAVSHSERFRAAYAPAYRVVSARLARLLPLLGRIDRLLNVRERVLVAVEGGSASGKTSLGALLHELYGCEVFHTDDFFLRPEQRTPERYAEPGGNVDRERLLAEVVEPLRRGADARYRPFDCSVMRLGEERLVKCGRLAVVEGAYSMHPSLEAAYDLSVFLDTDKRQQRDRILARNGEAMLARFLSEWIPLEEDYFERTRARERCTLALPPEA